MASSFNRKSASSGSNRRTSRDGRPTRSARSSRQDARQWHAAPGGRYSAPRAQSNRRTGNVGGQSPAGERLTSVRVGDLDRLERQTRAQKRYNRYLVRVGIVVAVFAALAIGFAVAYNSSLFTVTNVRVSGVEHLTSEEMQALAAVPSGTTLLRVDTAAIENRLKQDAWVQDATINRIPPDTLEIVVTERQIAAVVEVYTADGQSVQQWAIASDHMWLMPIPARDSEAGQRTSAKVYEDAANSLVIKDVPVGTKAQVGTYCTDDTVLNALDIVSGMTTDLSGRVKMVYAEGVEETRLVLDNNVEVAFGSAENIRDKERICLEIMEQHPDSVAYINVRDVNNPTYRAL